LRNYTAQTVMMSTYRGNINKRGELGVKKASRKEKRRRSELRNGPYWDITATQNLEKRMRDKKKDITFERK